MAYWCENCQVPVLGKVCYSCGAKLSLSFPDKAVPVFKEEIELLSKLTGETLEFKDCDLWTAYRYYYYQGRKSFKIEGGNLFERPKLKWLTPERKLRAGYFSKENLISANLPYLKGLEYKAILFIQEVKEKFSSTPLWTVAFSGGKDSAVVSHLVRKAFGTNEILHIFVDTTMELPPTYEYVEAFRRYYNVPLIKVQADKDYKEMWEKAGPPSRIHRWCCTVFKTGPYDKLLKQISENGKKVVTFEGIRACESQKRKKYNKVSFQCKVPNQIGLYPILNWTDIEIWIYVLAEEIIISRLYSQGLRRVGCGICPFASPWAELIMNYYYKDVVNEIITLFKIYIAQGKIPIKKDIYDYIGKGGWKMRAGSLKTKTTKELEFFNISKKNWVYFYRLNKKIDNFFFELFKPFGEVRSIGPNKNVHTYLVISHNLSPLFLINILNENYIQLKILSGKNHNEKIKLKRQFENQVTKFESCIFCGACASVCEQSAITLNGRYIINEKLCKHCLKCVYVVKTGCVVKEASKTYRQEGL